MNVGQLRKLIQDLPEVTEIVVCGFFEQYDGRFDTTSEKEVESVRFWNGKVLINIE